MVVLSFAAAAGGMEGQSKKIWMKISMISFQFQKMTWGHVRTMQLSIMRGWPNDDSSAPEDQSEQYWVDELSEAGSWLGR